MTQVGMPLTEMGSVRDLGGVGEQPPVLADLTANGVGVTSTVPASQSAPASASIAALVRGGLTPNFS